MTNCACQFSPGQTPLALTTLEGNGNRAGIERLNEPLTPDITAIPTTTFSYNGTKNRLSSDGTNSFGYDSEGQLNSGYGSTYVFDYEHRLTGISGTAQYSYDGSGNRLQAVRNGA